MAENYERNQSEDKKIMRGTTHKTRKS